MRVVVITGAGNGFCAGADLKQRAAISADDTGGQLKPGERGRATYDRLMGDFRDAVLAITHCPKPVIAAINVRLVVAFSP